MADNESQNKKALLFFELSDDRLRYHCKLPDCGKSVSASKDWNCVSHLKHKHTEIYLNTISKNFPHAIELKRLKFIQDCALIVAGDGRAFNALQDEGLLGISEEKLMEFKRANRPVDMSTNVPEIKLYIHQAALKLKEMIKNELKGQSLSLMTDIASKNGKSIISIDAQYMREGQIMLRCLGMFVMKKHSHNARNIKDAISECLEKFEISPKQIISFTTDNASNMIAMVEQFNEGGSNYDENLTERNENTFIQPEESIVHASE